MAWRCTASFSGRVAMRRRFLSPPTACSMMLRLRYCSRSKTGLLTGPPSALLDLVTALGDSRPYFVAPAPGPNGLRGVSLISRKALGRLTGPAVAAWDRDRLHERDELGALVHVARRQAKRRDRPLGVTHHVELRAEAPPAASQGVVAGLARGPGFVPSPRLRP